MSPRTPGQFKEMREEKRALIMDTALKEFANEGYHNTTISHIAKKAGISKGLLYNYFKSKEELLNSIISRSMEDVFSHFDPDHNGFLSEEDFESFLRILFSHIRENLSFWRLFYQLVLQKDVRDQFLKSGNADTNTLQKLYTIPGNASLRIFTKMMQDYFVRKKEKKPEGYDPVLDLNMFIYTVEGFTMVNAYLDEVDDQYDKTINRIIEIYK
jgi:Ca2+-binding EF-hand superfamily protein